MLFCGSRCFSCNGLGEMPLCSRRAVQRPRPPVPACQGNPSGFPPGHAAMQHVGSSSTQDPGFGVSSVAETRLLALLGFLPKVFFVVPPLQSASVGEAVPARWAARAAGYGRTWTVLYHAGRGRIAPPACLRRNFSSQGQPHAGRRLRQPRPKEPLSLCGKAPLLRSQA